MYIFRKFGTFRLLDVGKIPQLVNSLIEISPESFTSDYFCNCLLICLWHIRWFLEVLEVFELFLNRVFHDFKIILSYHSVKYSLSLLRLF